MIPNIPVGRKRNRPFNLNSDRNFRNLWHNGKHPLFPVEFQMAYVGHMEFPLLSSICQPRKRKTLSPARKCLDIMLMKIQYIMVLPLDAAFKCFEKISHKLVRTIHFRICISCIFSMLDATRSNWELISSKARLKCSSPFPSSTSFTLRFLLPWPFFLSKGDFGGAAVSFDRALLPCWTQQKGLKGCRYLLKIWPMKYPLLLALVSGSRHRDNPELHQFHHRK